MPLPLSRLLFSVRSRSCATLRSLGVRYRALWGLSGMFRNTKTETMILGKPSTRKSSRHEAMGIPVPILVMTHAKLLANEVASGAAEMKRPVLKANSSRL